MSGTGSQSLPARRSPGRAIVLGAVLGAAACLAATRPVGAAVGDVVHQFTVPVSGVTSFCSVGLAFDGSSLYYDRCRDQNIYRVHPVTGALLDTFDTDIAEFPNCLAYDGTRNGLWIGVQKPVGAADISSCAAGTGGLRIYFWDFDDDSVTMKFEIPTTLVNPATGEPFLFYCFCDGLAFNAEVWSDSADDELWFSDDVNRNVGLFRPDGTLVQGYDATSVHASLFQQSGLALGGDRLYMGNNGGGAVYVADALANPLTFVSELVHENERQEDMACDPHTFPAKTVMWVRTTPQGGTFPDVITAYEIDHECGPGGLGVVARCSFEGDLKECGFTQVP
jgi:hypothetical protein